MRAQKCLCDRVRSEVPGAERLHAASDLVVLCVQSQEVCGRESVAVHGEGHSACARRVLLAGFEVRVVRGRCWGRVRLRKCVGMFLEACMRSRCACIILRGKA